MPRRTFPGRMAREEWLKLSIKQRHVLAARAVADLRDVWRGCGKKLCRRAHGCQGDQRCKGRPYEADFNNPNSRQPGYVFSYQPPKHLRIPTAILDALAYWLELPAPEELVDQCSAEAGARAAAALRGAFRLERQRPARIKRGFR